jgi:hypothetical protein
VNSTNARIVLVNIIDFIVLLRPGMIPKLSRVLPCWECWR